MIGANRPACEVTVEGMSNGSINFESLGDTVFSPLGTPITNTMYASSCELADGRILVVWVDGTSIRQGYAASAETLFANDCLTNKTDLFTGLNTATSILCEIDAGLFLLVAWKQQNDDKVAKSLLYKSALGDGSDWTLHSTIQSLNWSTATDPLGTQRGMTKIFKIGSRYILQCPYFYINGSGWILSQYGIYDSTDLISWILKFAINTRANGNFNSGCSSTFVEIDNVTYWAMWSSYGGQKMSLIKSTDGFNLNQSTVYTISTDLNPYYDVAPYNSCSLYFDDDRFLIIGSQKIASHERLNIWGCPKTDIGTPTNYIIYAQTAINSLFQSSNVGQFLEIFANGKIVIWAEDIILGIETNKIISIPVKTIGINRNKNMAGSLSLAIDNKNGEWSPDNTVNQNVLFPNKEITVKQGYGINLINTFQGLIDRIEMTTFPHELKLLVRDKLKLALDQTITWTDGVTHVILFQSQPVETIFTTLCGYAGLTIGTIETTGLTITKTFSWETYADCFSFLSELVGFEYGADENGLIFFRKDTTPAIPTIAYEFKEGEDIISLGYTIDDNDLYSKVVVYGKDTNDNVLFAQKEYLSKDYYNVLPQKVMKIDVSEASTVEQLQAIADRTEMLMRSRVREVSFASLAIPWLQVGDIIRVTESSSTISELYRVTDLSTSMDSSGYTMQITCYHHSV
jgi:hypothetical protein